MRLLIIALLSGCTVVDYAKVRYVEVAAADLPQECPRLIGSYGGCVVFRGDIAEIRAPRPKDVRDSKALEVIGHEFYCHAWLKQSHTDIHGVRREPKLDCVPQGKGVL